MSVSVNSQAAPEAPPLAAERRTGALRRAGDIATYLALSIGAIFTLLPLFWMVSTSLKTPEEANAPQIVWWPASPQFDAYLRVLSDPDWLRALGNTVFVTGLAMAGTVISIAAVTYAFARIEWPGRSLFFFLMLSTLMLPPQTTLVPQYVFFNRIGWVGTFNPIIIPGFFAGGASLIFLLRQFMLTLPKEIDEAAYLDGANHFQIWWYIIMPLCRPALATITIFLFVGTWNSLQAPLIYLQNKELQTLPILISSLINPQQSTQPWPLIMAASVLTTLPLIAGFFAAQRYLLDSIVLSGSK